MWEKRKSYDVVAVRTVETKDTILAICQERADSWANAVQGRLLHVHDLPAADAVYHRVCSTNFRTKKQLPAIHVHDSDKVSKRVKLGRPQEKERAEAFVQVCNFLEENDDEQITVDDLIQLMEEALTDTEHSAYSYKHMQLKLKEHFGNKIVQTEINGKSNVITFRSKASEVLHDFYHQHKLDPEQDKIRIVETAAKLIKEDIKALQTACSSYPTINELSEEESIEFLPASLRVLLGVILVAGKDVRTKIASIGQAIMQAARPRVLLAPLQIGLGVQLHHHFASRFLIDSLHKHGFCSSYNEVHQFEQNAVLNYGVDIPEYSSQFIQYIADNVDHNIRTLDGYNTFHGMGMIAAVTPEVNKSKKIPSVKVTSKDTDSCDRACSCPFL